MTQTLRRELRLKFLSILSDYLDSVVIPEGNAGEMVDRLIDAALEMRVFQEKPKFNLKQSDPAWAILAGEDVDTSANILAKEATDTFERVFGFGTLPWNSDRSWEKFYKFVVRVYSHDKNVWRDYVEWRNDKGKYQAYSNRKIRENPAAFMDTGYPEFEASKMYANKSRPGRKFERLNPS